jgi:hypothetical protein
MAGEATFYVVQTDFPGVGSRPSVNRFASLEDAESWEDVITPGHATYADIYLADTLGRDYVEGYISEPERRNIQLRSRVAQRAVRPHLVDTIDATGCDARGAR